MRTKLRILYKRLQEQLWFRPLIFCLLSVFGALLALQADGLDLGDWVPDIDRESVEGLLDTLSASMLVISVFAVSSMLAAFSSASNTATPRSFKVVITDNASQNALSIFIGSFIFSIVATVALDNGSYDKAGRFVLFLFTLLLFAAVILTFLRWVNRISRLGRLEHTIEQIERVASESLRSFIRHPNRKALPISEDFTREHQIKASKVGYVQNLEVETLQELAEEHNLHIRLHCLPGQYVHHNRLIAEYSGKPNSEDADIRKRIREAIRIGNRRLFDEDPRFGLISLSEIASRALSPGINDPGTAIQIIGSHQRLFFLWQSAKEEKEEKPLYDRVEIPTIPLKNFFEDAFRPIARDGAQNIEVMLRLQKALAAIASIPNREIEELAKRHSKSALERAKGAMTFQEDLDSLIEHYPFK